MVSIVDGFNASRLTRKVHKAGECFKNGIKWTLLKGRSCFSLSVCNHKHYQRLTNNFDLSDSMDEGLHLTGSRLALYCRKQRCDGEVKRCCEDVRKSKEKDYCKRKVKFAGHPIRELVRGRC